MKFVVLFRGADSINNGGIVSLGPPVGVEGFAHLNKRRMDIIERNI
ncbi:MAG: hypothetical protein ACOCV8_03030 [Spirochaetota bacterium]